MTDSEIPKPARQRRIIPATCQIHGGPVGFCNLRISKVDASIVLDPHVDSCCILELDEAGATELFDALGEWLGCD